MQIGEEDHLQKGDVLVNINGEELTFKNKFELISKLSSLGGTAEVNVLRKALTHHHSSSLLTSSNYCFVSSNKTLSASNNNIAATSNANCSNNNTNNLNSSTSINLKTNSEPGPIIIPYHNGIFAQNSIKLAMRKYEKPAIKSTSDMDSNTFNNTNTLTNNENSNSNREPVEVLNVPSNASCFHVNTEILNEVDEGELIQEESKTVDEKVQTDKNGNENGENQTDKIEDENQEDEENCLLSSIHSDNWLLLIDNANANTNTNTKCSILQPEIPDLSNQQTCSSSSTTSSSPTTSNKNVNNLALTTALNTLTSSSCHSERSLVKLNCPIFYDEQQNQSKSSQDILVSSPLFPYECLDNQDEFSKNTSKIVKFGSDISTNDNLPSIKQYISTCQIEIKSCPNTQNVACQMKSKINVKNKPWTNLPIKSLKNAQEEEEDEGLKSSLTSITTTNTAANNAMATGGTEAGGDMGVILTTVTMPFYSNLVANHNSNRKENSENDCDQDQLDDVDVDLIDSNCYMVKESDKVEVTEDEETILNELVDDLITKLETRNSVSAEEITRNKIAGIQNSIASEEKLNQMDKNDTDTENSQKLIDQQSSSKKLSIKSNFLLE